MTARSANVANQIWLTSRYRASVPWVIRKRFRSLLLAIDFESDRVNLLALLHGFHYLEVRNLNNIDFLGANRASF